MSAVGGLSPSNVWCACALLPGRSSLTVWHLCASYRPDMVGKLLDILRVYYNYCPRPPTKDRKTPATRLGLAQGPVRPQEILYFKR